MAKVYKIGKTLINIVFYILVFLFIALLVSIIIFKVGLKEKVPRIFDYYVLEVMSGSMEPTINVGDFIVIKKQDSYKVGDIVAFELEDYVVTHRIYKMDNNTIITMGDANGIEDDPINKNQILGKYQYKSPFIGFIIRFRFIILALIIIFYALWKIIQYVIDKHFDSDKEKELMVKQDKISTSNETQIKEESEKILAPKENQIKEEPKLLSTEEPKQIIEKQEVSTTTEKPNKNQSENKTAKKEVNNKTEKPKPKTNGQKNRNGKNKSNTKKYYKKKPVKPRKPAPKKPKNKE